MEPAMWFGIQISHTNLRTLQDPPLKTMWEEGYPIPPNPWSPGFLELLVIHFLRKGCKCSAQQSLHQSVQNQPLPFLAPDIYVGTNKVMMMMTVLPNIYSWRVKGKWIYLPSQNVEAFRKVLVKHRRARWNKWNSKCYHSQYPFRV